MDLLIVEEIKEKWIQTSSLVCSISDEDRYNMRIDIVREYHDDYYEELYSAIMNSRSQLRHCPLIEKKTRCYIGCYTDRCITMCIKDMIHDVNLSYEEHLKREILRY